MSKEIAHSLILIISLGLSFFLPKTGLANYDLQLSAGLFVILFLAKKLLVPDSPKSRLLESVVFTIIIVSVVNTTGGVHSPFFFLIYFLLFSLSLLLEPITSITVTLTLIVLFLFSMPEGQNLNGLLPVLSLAFITPFALFMGQEYMENQRSKIKYQKSKEETFLFLSLVLKNHLKNIKHAVENFMGDHELNQIKNAVKRMNKLIEEFEKQQ